MQHVVDVGKKFIAVELLVPCMSSVRTTMKNCSTIEACQFFVINSTTFLIRQLCWIICSDEVLRLGLETIFANLCLEGFRSRLGLKGSRSQSQAYYLETVNIARIWLCKTFVNQQVFSLLYLQVTNNQNTSKKCQKFEKNSTLKR